MVRFLAIASLCILTAGCATVSNGRMQRVAVTSEPGGAAIRTRCGGIAAAEGVTPATIVVSRRAVPCEIVVEKDGYDPVTVVLERQLSKRFWRNIQIAPLAGLATGALASGDCDSGGFSICFSAEQTGIAGFGAGLAVGGIGMAIDGATGAMYQRNPAEIHVTLQPRRADE